MRLCCAKLCCAKPFPNEFSFDGSQYDSFSPAEFAQEPEGTSSGARVEERCGICDKCKYPYTLRCEEAYKCEYKLQLQVDKSFLKSGCRQLIPAPFKMGGHELQVRLTQTKGKLGLKLRVKGNFPTRTDIVLLNPKLNRIIFKMGYLHRVLNPHNMEHEYCFGEVAACRTIQRRSLGYINNGRFTVQARIDMSVKAEHSQAIVVGQDGDTFNLEWILKRRKDEFVRSIFCADCAVGGRKLWLMYCPKGQTLDGRDVVTVSLEQGENPVSFHVVMTSEDLIVLKSCVAEAGDNCAVLENLLRDIPSPHMKRFGLYPTKVLKLKFEIKFLVPSISIEDSLPKKDFFGAGTSAQERDLVLCVLCEKNPSNATIVHEENVYRECRIVCMDCGRDLQRQAGALCPKCNERFQRILET